LILLGEQYRSWSSSVCSFLQFHYLIPLRPKYSAQHLFLKHSQPMFHPQYQTQSFSPMQNNTQDYSSVCFDLKFFDSKLEDKRFCIKI
jgi:hypothetical protein